MFLVCFYILCVIDIFSMSAADSTPSVYSASLQPFHSNIFHYLFLSHVYILKSFHIFLHNLAQVCWNLNACCFVGIIAN